MSDVKNKAVRIVEELIFNVRWVLPLFYLGLVVMLFLYGYAFAREVVHLVPKFDEASTEELRVTILDMVDIVMIANLIKMIITGSYNSFISKAHGRANEQISSGMLKIKIGTSVIVVAMIHLLRSFIENLDSTDYMIRQLTYFGAFMAAALVLSVIEYLHIKGEAIETSIELEKEAHEKDHQDAH